MIQKIASFFGSKPPQRTSPTFVEPVITSMMSRSPESVKKHSYTKIFRWRLPDGQMEEPQTVEIAGSFNHWQKIPMERDSRQGAWHATVHHIPSNKTHHYMLFVDGKPAHDKTSDGLAVPGPEEEQYQLQTDRGPRVLILFAQAK